MRTILKMLLSLSVLALTACPGKPPVISSFTAAPASLPAGGGKVTLAWSVTDASSLSLDQGVGAVTGTTINLNPTSSKTYTLTATNASGSSTATATVTVAAPPPPPPPTAPSLTVSPTSSTVSAAGPSVIFTATPTNASGTVNWSLVGPGAISPASGPSTSYTPPASVSSATSATLTATLSGSSLTATASISISPLPALFVNPTNGADSNPGTQSAPFKTLKKALTVAKSSQVINLQDGTYNAASGEDFKTPVPDGVTIQAVNTGGAILVGVLGDTGLTFSGSGTARGLKLQNFDLGIQASTGTQTLSDLTLTQDSIGINVFGSAQTSLTNSSMDSDGYGASLSGTSFLKVTGGTFNLLGSSCRNGAGFILTQSSALNLQGVTITNFQGTAVVASDSSNVTVSNSVMDKNLFCGVPAVSVGGVARASLTNTTISNVGAANTPGLVVGGSGQVSLSGGSISANVWGILFSGGSLDIDGTSIVGNGGFGVLANASGTLNIKNAKVNNNSGDGIHISQDGVTLTLRNTEVRNNASFGINLQASSGTLNLGTASDLGGNTIQGNNLEGVLVDWTSGTVQAAGNTWEPNQQGADANGHYALGGTVSGNFAGKNYQINANVVIQF